MEKKFRTVHIVFHREDNDGVFSGALAYHYLKDKCENIIMWPSTYADISDPNSIRFFTNWPNTENPDPTRDLLVMLDISMKSNDMEKVYKVWGKHFIWCDHHKPIILASHQKPYTFGNCAGYHDRTDQSALIATYKYFNNMVDDGDISELPILFQYLGVYDSWSHEKRGFDFDLINHVNYCITYDTELDWHTVLDDLDWYMSPDCNEEHCRALAKRGEIIENVKIQDVCNILDNTAQFCWIVGEHDRDAVAIISPLKYNTAIYRRALNNYPDVLKDIDNIIVFSPTNNSDKWTMSLYNVDDHDTSFDCGLYLKAFYKGGGHAGAAGCILPFAKVKKILKEKAI